MKLDRRVSSRNLVTQHGSWTSSRSHPRNAFGRICKGAPHAWIPPFEAAIFGTAFIQEEAKKQPEASNDWSFIEDGELNVEIEAVSAEFGEFRHPSLWHH